MGPRRAPLFPVGCLLTLVFALCQAFAVDPSQTLDAGAPVSKGEPSADRLTLRILALFTGSPRNLGLDHKIGRQVLKLAAAKARKLNPDVASIELLVYNDDLDCNNLSDISSHVAERFYVDQAGPTSALGPTDSAECPPEWAPGEGLDSGQLDTCSIDDATPVAGARAGWSKAAGRPRRIDAILGPSCDAQIDSVARMAAYWRTPIYTVTPTSGLFSRKDIYSTLTRLSPSIDHLCLFVVRVMERFKWRHMAVVVDQSQAENAALLQSLEKTVERMRYSVPIDRYVFAFASFLDHTANATGAPAPETGHCTREARATLEGVRRVARVVLLLLNDPMVVRRFLLCAYELHFHNGEYTFLALTLGFKSVEQDNPENSQKADGAGATRGGSAAVQSFYWFVPDDEENNLKARQMFESLMVFSVELPIGDEFTVFADQTIEMARLDYPNAHFRPTTVGQIAVAIHDSLLLAVEARRRQFAAGLAPANGSARPDGAPLMWNERFTGGLMTNIDINSNGDQELNYVLADMVPELGIMRPVASYSKETRQLEMIADSFIHWPARAASLSAAALAAQMLSSADAAGPTSGLSQSEEPPPDEPECGFTGEAERCIDRENMYMALAIVSLFLVSVLAILAVSFQRYRKIQYQMQLDDYWWRISWADLEFIEARRTSIHSNMEASSVVRLRSRAAAGHRDGSVISENSCRSQTVGGDLVSKAAAAPVDSTKGFFRALQTLAPQPAAPVSLVVTPAAGTPDDGAPDGRQAHHARAHRSDRAEADDDRHSRAGSATAKSSLVDCQASLSNIVRSDLSTMIRASSLALYRDELVIVKQLNASSIEVSRSLLVELKAIRELSHENLARLVGLCVETDHLASVYEYCSRGNLQDLLLNKDMAMDWNLKYSIIGDILNGLHFIHTTLLDFHGRLKSTNLVLDSRFTVKLIDFGLKSLYNQLELIEQPDEDEAAATAGVGGNLQHQAGAGADALEDELELKWRRQSATHTVYNMDSVSMRAENLEAPTQAGHASGVSLGSHAPRSNRMPLKNRAAARFFWTAPEHLRERHPHLAASRRGDIYSLSIILFEIFTCREPYYYGTNAKPRWRVIKHDKLRQQQQQQQHQQQATSMGGSLLSKSLVSRQLSDANTRSARQSILSKARRRRNQATIAPLVEHPVGASRRGSQADLGDLESCASSSVVQSGGVELLHDSVDRASQAGARKDAADRSITINVSSPADRADSIDLKGEEPVDGDRAAPSDDARRRSRGSVSASSRAGSSAASTPNTKLRARKAQQSPVLEEAPQHEAHEASDELDAEEILDQLRMGVQPEPVRPYIPSFLLADINPKLVELLKSCWSEQPSARPNAAQLRNSMRRITKGATAKNYLDNLLDRLQTYAAQLERIVDFKSADILNEKARTDELLYQLVPRFVADKLKQNEPIMPQVFDGVTILFSDIVGFEKYASVMSPCELVDLLNNIYSSFESIISSFDVTKIEVILDQFLVAAGISLQQPQEAADGKLEELAEGKKQQQVGAEARAIRRTDSGEGKPAGAKSSRRGLLRALRRSQSVAQDKQDGNKKTPDGQAKATGGATGDSFDQASDARQSGLDVDHYKRSSAEQIARMALCIRDLVKSVHFRQNLTSFARGPADGPPPTDEGEPASEQQLSGRSFVAATFNIRIGIHSGKVCAGIVGLKRPKFCLIGDTVNVASRMHTNSKASRIQISADTRELLRQVPGFNIEPRGRIEIKGKGLMDTYWLESGY